MIAPFNGPALGNIMQVAWVTPSLERSMEQFKELYRIPKFMAIDLEFPAEVFGEKGQMGMRVALANVDNMQIELIEPVSGNIASFYRDPLPKDGSHANVFHHVCVKVKGTLADWDAYVAQLEPEQKIVYIGSSGPENRFIYTDQRSSLGIYLEHIWQSPETEARLAANVPTYHTS